MLKVDTLNVKIMYLKKLTYKISERAYSPKSEGEQWMCLPISIRIIPRRLKKNFVAGVDMNNMLYDMIC